MKYPQHYSHEDIFPDAIRIFGLTIPRKDIVKAASDVMIAGMFFAVGSHLAGKVDQPVGEIAKVLTTPSIILATTGAFIAHIPGPKLSVDPALVDSVERDPTWPTIIAGKGLKLKEPTI